MKVILVGYGEMFRSLALGLLSSKHEIVGVFRGDFVKKSRLKRRIYDYFMPSDDYFFVKTRALKEIDAKSVNSKEFRKAVKTLKADVVIVGSWSEKFSMQTLNLIPNGFINVHPSLLPKYRGPNPYIQVILNNETVSGITFHLMDVGYDTGAVLHQKEVNILPDDTGGSLKLRCCNAAKNEVVFLLDNFKNIIANQKSQVETEATYQSSVSLEETILDFEHKTAAEIALKIKAFSPWIDCYIPINGEFFRFKKYKISKHKLKRRPGTIVTKSNFSIGIICKDFTVMKFAYLEINRPFSKYISGYFFKNFIKVNDRAV